MLSGKRLIMAIAALAAMMVLMTACGGGGKSVDYEHQRELSWEGTELTIKLGENQSSGCVWKTKSQDDSVIDYSVNRKFKMAGASELSKGDAVGTLEAGFAGKGAGTTEIVCTTPVGWDGTGDGYTYIVTVTVKEDGTIENATGEESDTKPAESDSGSGESEATEQSETTLESYFDEHPDELEGIKANLNDTEEVKGKLTVDVVAKGNKLSYIYTFNETYPAENIEAAKADMQESLDTDDMKQNMKEQVKNIESEYGVSGVKIHVEYRNGDGAKICDATYK